MANPEHLAILRQGVEEWNAWRKDHPDVRPDLVEANLRGANLRGADFRRADLNMARLKRADLSGANLRRAKLRRADLRGANLSGANLGKAKLSDALLNGVMLYGAVLIHTDLSGAEFTRAFISDTVFANLDLRAVKGLDTCQHQGPSAIAIDTITKSRGDIPEAFLRSAGVPEPFITKRKMLVAEMEPIQFYSCFISYSSHDQPFAERLHAELLAKNLRVWFASEDLKIGDRFQERIEESIRLYDKVIIILSEASVQSRWVEREVTAAWERENRDNPMVLFPICIDDAVMVAPQPWAADIRRLRHIGDFRQWKEHDLYQKAFERLLRDLKKETKTAPDGAAN